jgi:hypothetical protein
MFLSKKFSQEPIAAQTPTPKRPQKLNFEHTTLIWTLVRKIIGCMKIVVITSIIDPKRTIS